MQICSDLLQDQSTVPEQYAAATKLTWKEYEEISVALSGVTEPARSSSGVGAANVWKESARLNTMVENRMMKAGMSAA
jgi:hypothetical protein